MTTSTSATSLDTTKGEKKTRETHPIVAMAEQMCTFLLNGLGDHQSISIYFLFLFSRVVSLSMSPVDDTFISGSLDKTIRLWDLRSPNCQVGSLIPLVSSSGLS